MMRRPLRRLLELVDSSGMAASLDSAGGGTGRAAATRAEETPAGGSLALGGWGIALLRAAGAVVAARAAVPAAAVDVRVLLGLTSRIG